jgi:hypothetical protein
MAPESDRTFAPSNKIFHQKFFVMQTNLVANFPRFTFAVILFSFLLAGCYGDNHFGGSGGSEDEDCLTPDNTTSSKTLTTGIFSEIRIAEAWGKRAEVTIEKGDRYEVTIEGAENVVEAMTASTSSKVLQLSLVECFNGTVKVNVTITTPTLTRLNNLAWGANIRVKGFSGESLEIANNNYADLDFDINYKTLKINSTETGIFVFTGQAEKMEGVFGGISSLKSFGLETKEADITSSTFNHIEVKATEQLTARITSSGNILYKGRPTIHESISGTGQLIDAN